MDRYYVYGVNFKDNGKIYNFKSKIRCPINVTVITETEKGLQFGKIVNYINLVKALPQKTERAATRCRFAENEF